MNTREDVRDFYFQWHITDRCNYRCGHCYQVSYSRHGEMSLEELKGVVNKIVLALRKWGRVGRIALTGGEPLTRRELFPLIAYLQAFKEIAHIDILSNGSLVDNTVANQIHSFSKLRRVQISLEGAFPETNDAIRGRGSFEGAVRAIRLLKSHDITVALMFTVHKGNVEEVPSVFDLAIAEGIDFLTVERLVPTGSAKTMKHLLLSPHELRSVYQYIVDRADEEHTRGTPLTVLKYRTLFACLDPSRLVDPDIPVPRQLGASCSIGMDALTILPDGTVLPCRRLPLPIGNLEFDSIFKIWYTSDVLWTIRDKRNLKGKCHSCKFVAICGGCRAIAFACTGDFLEEDPQCWMKTTPLSTK